MKTTFVLSTLLSICMSQRDTTVCTPPMQHAGPPKPTFPTQYTVNVECNILNRKSTTFISENYDYVNNRGAMTQVGDGTIFKGYFDYSTNEYLSVLPGSAICTVEDLSKSASNFIFGYNPGIEGHPHIFSASGAMHFAANTPEVYMKKDVIRGIPVDTWYSCQYWRDMNATMNVTWYFSDQQNWDSSLGRQSVPVAAHVTGNIHNGANFRSFEHWYHFYQFTPGVQDTDFEIPDGVVCPHRKNIKAVPQMSNSFMFMGEEINATRDQLSYLGEKYDQNQQIAAYTYKPNSELGMEYGVNRMVEINDFRTGVAYIMDTLLGNCTITQIDHGNFLYKRKSRSTRQVRMPTPPEIFLMDDMVSSYTYIGKRNKRGIMCDTWTGIYKSQDNADLTVEWYFLAGNWTTWNDATPLFPGSGVPIAMVTRKYDTASMGVENEVGLQTGQKGPFANRASFYGVVRRMKPVSSNYQFNVFNFDRSVPNVLDYDISPCFVNDNRRMFHVSLDGKYEGFVSDNMEMFRYSFLSTVVGLCNISPLRVANVKVDLDEDIHVTFELLDVAPVVGDNVAPQVSISEAADIFINTVQRGNFRVVWNAYINGVSQAPNMTVQSDSLREMDYETRQFGYTGSIGFGPGSMAGVAFAMMIIGGTIGAGTGFFCYL